MADGDCQCCVVVSFGVFFYVFGTLHSSVLAFHRKEMSEDLRRPLLQVLNSLEIYRVVALLALGFAVWSFKGKPRWLAWIALPLALLAVALALLIQ
jgi:hypothetical protein